MILPDLLESVARLRVKVAGTFKGARREINFTSSDASVSITGTDDSVNERMTLDLTGAGGTGATLWKFDTSSDNEPGTLTLYNDESVTVSIKAWLVELNSAASVIELYDDGAGTASFGVLTPGSVAINAADDVDVDSTTGDVTVTSTAGDVDLVATAANVQLTAGDRVNITGVTDVRIFATSGHLVRLPAPSSAPTSGGAHEILFYIDESLHNLKCLVTYADGLTTKTATVPFSTTTYGNALLSLADGAALAALLPALSITNAQLAGSISLAKLATDPLARANHTGTQSVSTLSDEFDATAPTTQAIGDAAVVGSATTAAHRDHKHAMPAFAAPGLTLGTANAAGAAATLIRTDATILAFDATAPTTSGIADVAAVGVATVAARRDHTHGREDLDQSNCAPAANETIAANYSAVVVGPYTIASGVLVTIGSGGALAIL